MEKESRIELRNVGDVTVLAIFGSFDVTLAPTLKVKLESLIRFGHQKIVVNFKGTHFVDSTGVGTLMFGLKQIDP
ncbi:MAG: STAS domain-containing protein, partial [bacterium]